MLRAYIDQDKWGSSTLFSLYSKNLEVSQPKRAKPQKSSENTHFNLEIQDIVQIIPINKWVRQIFENIF